MPHNEIKKNKCNFQRLVFTSFMPNIYYNGQRNIINKIITFVLLCKKQEDFDWCQVIFYEWFVDVRT